MAIENGDVWDAFAIFEGDWQRLTIGHRRSGPKRHSKTRVIAAANTGKVLALKGASAFARRETRKKGEQPVTELKRAIVMSDLSEPEASILRSAAYRSGFRVHEANSEISEAADSNCFALNVVGRRSCDADLLARVSMLRKALPQVATVVVTPELIGTTAFRLAQLGASELVTTPVTDPQAVLRHAKRAAPEQIEGPEISELAGHSQKMGAVRKRIAQAGPTDSTVLLTGETGTGKGVAARALHRLSQRREHPFVHVDCAALSPTMIESELFGHERGAFTGAVARRSGRFELARTGTVFLDEIGELDASLQAKFLRVLEDREFERIGDVRTQRMTARVIAATNRDLRDDVRTGRLRSDLYFRLNVVQIRMPSLRERIVDVPVVARELARRKAQELRLPCPGISESFCDRAMQQKWPGNVRELANVIERLLVSGTSPGFEAQELDEVLLEPSDCDLAPTASDAFPNDPNDTEPPQGDERSHIATELLATGGNVARVARRLNIPRSTLRYKIRRYELRSLVPRD